MRGSKHLTAIGNRDQRLHNNSENMENDSKHGFGVLRIGRFRLRIPSNEQERKMISEAGSNDDMHSISTASLLASMEDFDKPHHEIRPPSVIVKHLNELDDMLMNHQMPSPYHSRNITIHHNTESLSEAFGLWLQASETLLRSDEMQHFLSSTRNVVCSVGDLAVRTALLPVTLPLHVVCSTTELVLGGTLHIVTSAGTLIGSAFWSLTMGGHRGQGENEERAEKPPKRLNASFHEDENHFLDKLRLDFAPNESQQHLGGNLVKKVITTSEYLLRVNDLGVMTLDGKGQQVKVHYVDLICPRSDQNKAMIQSSLYRLFLTGLSLLSKHPTVRLTKHYPSDYTIDWKAESSTARLLREMAKMSTMERLQLLQKNVLIWSGKFRDERNKNALPAFLARGIVEQSPRDFMMLLWDNARTAEYNNYCVSRTDALVIHDKILEGASEGAKVVQSETRVPYTNLTVKAKCLMHVRPLEAPDAGFVILSRSLDAGEAGMHFTSSGPVQRSSKNEILWGINVFRAVPNHPYLTDLTSLSQVSSSLVPTFMANRIGLMGVEDFFKNVRAGKV